jgi:hypothetical protein
MTINSAIQPYTFATTLQTSNSIITVCDLTINSDIQPCTLATTLQTSNSIITVWDLTINSDIQPCTLVTTLQASNSITAVWDLTIGYVDFAGGSGEMSFLNGAWSVFPNPPYHELCPAAVVRLCSDIILKRGMVGVWNKLSFGSHYPIRC